MHWIKQGFWELINPLIKTNFSRIKTTREGVIWNTWCDRGVYITSFIHLHLRSPPLPRSYHKIFCPSWFDQKSRKNHEKISNHKISRKISKFLFVLGPPQILPRDFSSVLVRQKINKNHAKWRKILKNLEKSLKITKKSWGRIWGGRLKR